jgi:broad specificity phosphatase PhoE
VVLIRHGQTEWNVLEQYQGSKNSNLTEQGQESARLLGKRLAFMHKKQAFGAVYSSTLGRAHDTAKIALSQFSEEAREEIGEIQLDERIDERCMGELEGQLKEEVRRQHAGIMDRIYGVNVDYHPPGDGESMREVRARVFGFLEEIKQRAITQSNLLTDKREKRDRAVGETERLLADDADIDAKYGSFSSDSDDSEDDEKVSAHEVDYTGDREMDGIHTALVFAHGAVIATTLSRILLNDEDKHHRGFFVRNCSLNIIRWLVEEKQWFVIRMGDDNPLVPIPSARALTDGSCDCEDKKSEEFSKSFVSSVLPFSAASLVIGFIAGRYMHRG